MKRPPKWERELPREWGKGTITVEGDELLERLGAMKSVAKVIGAVAVIWVFVTAIFLVTGRR